MNLDDLAHFKKLDTLNMLAEIDGLPDLQPIRSEDLCIPEQVPMLLDPVQGGSQAFAQRGGRRPLQQRAAFSHVPDPVVGVSIMHWIIICNDAHSAVGQPVDRGDQVLICGLNAGPHVDDFAGRGFGRHGKQTRLNHIVDEDVIPSNARRGKVQVPAFQARQNSFRQQSRTALPRTKD